MKPTASGDPVISFTWMSRATSVIAEPSSVTLRLIKQPTKVDGRAQRRRIHSEDAQELSQTARISH